MDLLDMSVTLAKGNRYVLVMVAVGRCWERVAMDLLDMSDTSAKGYGGLLLSMDGGLPAII